MTGIENAQLKKVIVHKVGNPARGNFHIYIPGQRELIEKAVDEKTGRK